MAGEMLVYPLSPWLGRSKSSMQNTVQSSPFSFVAWFAQLFEELLCQTERLPGSSFYFKVCLMADRSISKSSSELPL